MQLEARSRLDNTLTSVFVFVDLKNPSFGPWELQEEQEDMKIMMDHAASVYVRFGPTISLKQIVVLFQPAPGKVYPHSSISGQVFVLREHHIKRSSHRGWNIVHNCQN